MRIFSIYDTKAEYWSTPAFIRTDAEARRMFSGLVQDPQNPIGAHPEDYILYRLGKWDPEKGVITPEPGVAIAMGIEFITKTTTSTEEN